VTVCGGGGDSAEGNDAACADGIDNDDDGHLDCDDFDCSRNDTVSVCGGGNACDACVNEAIGVRGACEASMEACASRGACQGILICIEDCADDACANACLAEDAEGAALYEAVVACIDAECANACN